MDLNMPHNNINTRETLVAYLNNLNIGVLSTIRPNGTPYSAVVYFVVDHSLNFYFLTKSDTKKSDNLQKNNNASFTTIDLTSMITVQSTGTVEKVTDPEQHTFMIKSIGEANARKNNPQWPPPISKLDSTGNNVIYKYKPNWIRLANYSHQIPSQGAQEKQSIFTEFIPRQKPNQ